MSIDLAGPSVGSAAVARGRSRATWRKRAGVAASALLFAAGGMLATASPAAADGPCPANRLCIYDQPNFSGNRILSASTNACFLMRSFDFGTIVSYDNNLPVDARVWTAVSEGPYLNARTLPAGGFSSNVSQIGLGVYLFDEVCMGNARP
ncbi:peptidase inhibitor family I36 protein [Streptomyces liangshanensis]|uniref:Peptidase inhibitor family I36 protein n=1 Tax=Streptomyces liangshanensis TaxID=2717324 RepID=A0A6G9GVY9_9ACTN|nr:peptidase inhibitor family I36 protein [Streptomyces liangshanensis]QIQ02219.1 peptidase inhibitor family I36 protein [Streptomyces liangshanensis]